ncbi:MAG: hypothetical protein NE327_16020 [Lentisphaeraceae bacterium]|nr:hypothetical protein [Lentisphaeraceae bacterium]
MNLASQQKILAEFLLNKNSKGNSFLESVNQAELKRFKESLVRKRFKAVSAILPITFKVLPNEELMVKFQEHCKGFTPKGVAKHHLDAYHFAKYLVDEEGGFVSEVLKYEMALITISQKWSRVHFFKLRHTSKALEDLEENNKTHTFFVAFNSLLLEISVHGIKRHLLI